MGPVFVCIDGKSEGHLITISQRKSLSEEIWWNKDNWLSFPDLDSVDGEGSSRILDHGSTYQDHDTKHYHHDHYDADIDEDILQYQYLCQTRAGRNDLAEIGLWGRKIGNRHRLASSWCDIDLMFSWGYNKRGDLWFVIFLMMSSLFVAARESWTKTNKQRF